MDMQSILITYVGAGLLIMLASIPLWLGKVPPNDIYGVRLPSLKNDPKLWYKANAYGGKLLFFAGLIAAFFSASLFFDPHIHTAKYAFCCAGILLGSILFAFSMILRFVEANK